MAGSPVAFPDSIGATAVTLEPDLQPHLARLAVGHPGGLPGYLRDALLDHVLLAAATRGGWGPGADMLRALRDLGELVLRREARGATGVDLERALNTAEALGISPVGDKVEGGQASESEEPGASPYA